jgi:type IV secretory pathway VirD2 relaxase
LEQNSIGSRSITTIPATPTHVIVRGVTDDRKILNIAGDYIAHGIRHRASELVTRELGPQTELDVARKLGQ